jgi:hypothetical protein
MTGGDPFAPFAANTLTSVQVFGIEIRRGDRVRLWPQRQADIFDMALAGKVATVEAIEQTVEDEIYLAVTVDEDPGSDLGNLRQIGHRFFFRAEEIEPITADRTEEK